MEEVGDVLGQGEGQSCGGDSGEKNAGWFWERLGCRAASWELLIVGGIVHLSMDVIQISRPTDANGGVEEGGGQPPIFRLKGRRKLQKSSISNSGPGLAGEKRKPDIGGRISVPAP